MASYNLELESCHFSPFSTSIQGNITVYRPENQEHVQWKTTLKNYTLT